MKKKNHYIGSIKDATSYSNDNVYIHKGYLYNFNLKYRYRINYDTPNLIIKSLFHKHNELLNIWTHLIGGAIILGFIYYVHAYYSTVNRVEIRGDLDKIFDPLSIGYFYAILILVLTIVFSTWNKSRILLIINWGS